MAVAIVVQKRAARAPSTLCLRHSGLVRNIRKGPIAIIVKQNVMSPEGAEQVVPAVVVVIAYAHAGLPTGAS